MAHYMTFKVRRDLVYAQIYPLFLFLGRRPCSSSPDHDHPYSKEALKMHLAEIFLLSSKCWQSLIIKIVVVAIVCQNIPWRCRTESSGIAASIYRSSRGKVGREENMHINDNALFVHAGNDDIQNSVMIISQTDLQDYPIVLLYLWKKKCRETKKSRSNALEMANAETYGGIVSVRREKTRPIFLPF